MPAPKIGRASLDATVLITYCFLVFTGLVMINSTGAPPEGYAQDWAGMISTPMGKQFIWVVISALTWFGIHTLIDFRTWIVSAYPIYIGTLVLLVLVLLVGKEINGARSWFAVGGFTFQPGELAKFGTCLAMAAFLSQWTGKFDTPRTVLTGFVLWLLPALVIMGQPDAGSALVFTSFLLVMYREGLAGILYLLSGFTALMFVLGILYPPLLLIGILLGLFLVLFGFSVPKRGRWLGSGALVLTAGAIYAYLTGLGWYFIAGLAALTLTVGAYHLIRRRVRLVAVSAIAIVWGSLLVVAANYTFNNVLRPHHQERINVWLRPEGMDPRGALYNVLQSKLAISAGGLSGRGFQQGTMTKYDYVPEQMTDFIFCALGEEQGFFGTSLVIVSFLILLWRISVIAERQKRTFARAYAYGVAGILLIHLLVNVGMTMGLLPVIGIPLPFMSKGGSSLLSFTIMLAVLLKLDAHRGEV